MKLTVSGVKYTRRDKWWWCEWTRIEGPLADCLDALADARHQAAEILETTTEAMRHARTETNRWKRLASDAREVLRRIDDADAADSQDLRAIRSWCASFDAENVDL